MNEVDPFLLLIREAFVKKIMEFDISGILQFFFFFKASLIFETFP